MRLIQAGVGGFGQSWIYTARECDGFKHVALVDPSPDALRKAGEIAEVPIERQFASLEEALTNVEADGFIDCTPVPSHEQTSTAAMRHGLHVLSEKPLAENMDSAIRIVRTAQETGRILMVTQQFRYYDQPRCLRRLIEEGAIGDVDHVLVEFQIQGLLFGWRQKMAHPFLMDMAVHHFDTMRYLLGVNAETVMAKTWNPCVSNVTGDMSAFVWIEFEGGAKVNYTGSFASPGTDTGWNGRWVITGSRGTVIWNSRDDWGPIRLFRQNSDKGQYQTMHFFTPLPEPWGEPIPVPSIGAQGHHFDLYHWRACIDGGVEPETSGRDNLNTLALVFAAAEAANTGKLIEVPKPQI